MKTIAWVLIASALALGAGCAQKDWIDRTLVTVDVTGTWTGTLSAGTGASGGSYGVFLFDLEQQGATVKGIVRGDSRGLGAQGQSVGPIEGTVSGDVFRFSDSRGILTGEVTVRGDEMDGQATSFAGTRSFSLRRVDPSSRPASPPR